MSSVAAAVLSAIVSLGRSLLCARSLSRESLYVDVVDVDVVDPPGICASILSWEGARHLQGGGLMFNVWVVLML